MNILLWIFQILLALHTVMGAVWKISNSAEQTMPSLRAIPHKIWVAMAVIELIGALALILPALDKSLGSLPPVAAAGIAAEMLFFCGLHIFSETDSNRPIIYWLVVAAICTFIAFGRFVLQPF